MSRLTPTLDPIKMRILLALKGKDYVSQNSLRKLLGDVAPPDISKAMRQLLDAGEATRQAPNGEWHPFLYRVTEKGAAMVREP